VSTREPRPTDDPTTKEPRPTHSSSSPKPTDPSEGAIVRTKDVPVGGGVVVTTYDVVVTQPTSGDFRAFAARCTHRGCLLGPVSSGEIRCPCHSSRFSIDDGSPIYGPAPTALPTVAITVDKGYVYPA
jgi:nitrite reductase/ring-hydroxylating ferredoxin subunit